MFGFDLKTTVTAALVVAVTLHTAYVILKSLWNHRDPPGNPSAPRRKFELKISYESEPPPLPAEVPPVPGPGIQPGRILRLN